MLAEVAQLIQLGVIAGANNAGIGGKSRWIVGDGALEAFADVGEFVDFVVEAAEEFAPARRGRDHEILQHRELAERFAQRDEFARSGQAQCDAAGEAFQVQNSAKFLANFSSHHGLLD